MATPPFDTAQAHKWFAVECNNHCWDLVEANERSAEQIEQMIHLAHSARFHWSNAGTNINLLRADVLLSTAYSVAKRPDGAVRYSSSAEQFLKDSQGVTHFDRATVSGAKAFAYQIAYEKEKASAACEEFQQRLEEIDEQADKTFLMKLYPVL